jgi:hypothetical protein
MPAVLVMTAMEQQFVYGNKQQFSAALLQQQQEFAGQTATL